MVSVCDVSADDFFPPHLPPPVVPCKPSKFAVFTLVHQWTFTDCDTLSALQSRAANCSLALWPLSQPQLTSHMRRQVLDWLMNLCADHCLKRETFHTAVWILDSFLARAANAIEKCRFQLVALAAVMVAAKLEEISPPLLTDYTEAVAFGFSPKEIVRMEQAVLRTLQWRIAPSTLSSWMNWTLAQWDEFADCQGGNAPRFKTRTKEAYSAFRYCAQLADSVLFKLNYYEYQKEHLSAAILYLGLAHAISNFDDSLEAYSDRSDTEALRLFPVFVHSVFGIDDCAEVQEAVEFIWEDGRVLRTLEMPKACEVLSREELERHFEDFLAYQTYADFAHLCPSPNI